MLFMRKSPALPSAAEALPGRPTPIPTATTHFVNGRPLQPPYPQGLEQAVFGLGCFWGAERKFWELRDGIYVTAVGYAGGHTKNPTYEEVCSGRTGHTEAVLVVFDPKTISYEQLLKTFWESHDPTQGMRQGTTSVRSIVRRSTPSAMRSAAPSTSRGHPISRRCRTRASAPSPPKSHPPANSTSPRIITSSIWRKIPTAIAAS